MKEKNKSYCVVVLLLNLFLFACEQEEPQKNEVQGTGKTWEMLKAKLELKEGGNAEWEQIEEYGESVLNEIEMLYGGGHGWYFAIPVKSSSGKLEKVVVYPIVSEKFQGPKNGVLKEQIQITEEALKAEPTLKSYLPPGRFDELFERGKMEQVGSGFSRENLSRSIYPKNHDFRVVYTYHYWATCKKDNEYSVEGPSFCVDKELKIFNCLYFR